MTDIAHTRIREVLSKATAAISGLKGHILDVVDIKQPPDTQYAIHLAKVISKLSPLVGNMIEFSLVSLLNKLEWDGLGQWERQDPGFPDTIFRGSIEPRPGIEIKTWFPLATEITARFKDSVLHFASDQTYVAVIAWLPDHLLYGKPVILDVWIDSARSLAIARDQHYHNPPDYLVIEPEDTTARTANLQQTNTNGYKFQGTLEELQQAEREVQRWGKTGKAYQPTPSYQRRLRGLLGRYSYRLDTNFAKIDRIEHQGLEEFKTRVLASEIRGHTVAYWAKNIPTDLTA
ncbi:MAG: hypothetical protein HYR71_04855 [Chloroflexi bacterium]|nr:hypothetical protein [Chloroflexota bacterium]